MEETELAAMLHLFGSVIGGLFDQAYSNRMAFPDAASSRKQWGSSFIPKLTGGFTEMLATDKIKYSVSMH